MRWLILSTAALMMAQPALAAGDAAAGQGKATVCFACHGANGKAVIPNYPNLAGQRADYLEVQLKAFRDGTRVNPIMAPMAKPLSDADIGDLAAFFASLPAGG